MRLNATIIACALALVNAYAGTLRADYAPDPGRVLLNWDRSPAGGFGCHLVCRSTTSFDQAGITPGNLTAFPVTSWCVTSPDSVALIDERPAENIDYYYVVFTSADGRFTARTAEVRVSVPNRALPDQVAAPQLRIDKSNYTLELCDDTTVVKRYPVVLGADPVTRKLHQDNRTTPEGTYRVTAKQFPATFYRAFPINYPNAADRRRYAEARRLGRISPGRSIGGSIQVHGCGLERNWTYGCIALRNEDMDELWTVVRVGTPVVITP